MVAVCRMAPQAALLEQSLAVGHRHPAGNTTTARRAWSPSVQAGTLQETTPAQWPASDHPPVHRAGKGSERRPPRDLFSLRPRERPGPTEEGFCFSILALMASEGFLPVSRVTSPFRTATTEGNRFTHSMARSPEGSLISWAYWCPKRRSASVRLKRSTMPWSLWMSTRLSRTWTESAHELAPRVNLKELRPPQGSPLVNPSKAIDDLCRSLASQGLSLFVASGDVNDCESITEGFLSYTVVWQEEQVCLMDLVWYRHVKFRPWYVSWSRQIELPDGLLYEPVLGLLLSHLCCRRQLFDGCEPLPVVSGTVVNG